MRELLKFLDTGGGGKQILVVVECGAYYTAQCRIAVKSPPVYVGKCKRVAGSTRSQLSGKVKLRRCTFLYPRARNGKHGGQTEKQYIYGNVFFHFDFTKRFLIL